MLRCITLALGAAALFLSGVAYAADVKVTGVHICCPACTGDITAKLTAAGATNIEAKPGSGTVSFTADDAQKVVNALFEAGYAGKVEGAKTPEVKGVEGVKGTAIKVEGVHLCCGRCVQMLNAALKDVGTTDAKPRAAAFTVTATSETEAAAVVKALRAAGFNARIAK
jgi:copper chaperone CopZ